MLDRLLLEDIGTPATAKQSLRHSQNRGSQESTEDPPSWTVDKMSMFATNLFLLFI